MIRDTLFCLSHPFQCVGDALGPYWWLIAIFAGLILIGIAIRVWHVARGLGGVPAAIGAVGILGTIALALGAALTRRDDREPIDLDGPDVEPPRTVRRPTPKPPRKPLFRNAPWNKGT